MRAKCVAGLLVAVMIYIAPFAAHAQTPPLSDLEALRYIASQPDLIDAFGADAAKGRAHYEQWGIKEGRKITFEPSRYMASHPDLIQAFAGDERQATAHYIQWGYKEKRQTTFSDLDALQYIASFGDLVRAFGTDVAAGIRHYVTAGYREGRRIVFDALAYIASYGDLIAAFGTNAVSGARHYINWGLNEGRRVIFDAAGYLARYADLQQAFGTDTVAATQHYINWGFKEGRTFSSSFLVRASWGPGGSISPASANVIEGRRGSFMVTADAGYEIESVTGCGGTLTGTSYTTGTISAACVVTSPRYFVGI